MEVQVIKEPFRFIRVAGDVVAREVLQTVTPLPDRAEEIIDWEASVRSVSSRGGKGVAYVTGINRAVFIYRDEHKCLQVVEDDVSFEYSLELTEASVDREIRARVIPVEMEHEISEEGRSVQYRVILEIYVSILQPEQIDVVQSVTGPRGIIVNSSPLRLKTLLKSGRIAKTFTETVALPEAAAAIIRAAVSARRVMMQMVDNAIKIQGDLYRQILFYTPEKLPRYYADLAPLDITVKIPAGFETSRAGEPSGPFCRRQIVAEIFTFVDNRQLAEGYGSKVNLAVTIEIVLRLIETKDMMLIEGITGPSLRVTGKAIKAENLLGVVRVEGLLHSTVELPGAARDVLQVSAHFGPVETDVVDGQIYLRGKITERFFYIDAAEEKLCFHREEISWQWRAEPVEDDLVICPAGEVKYRLVAPDRIEQAIQAELPAIIKEEVCREAVTEIRVIEPSHMATKIYIAREGDSLPVLARRFGFKAHELIEANPHLESLETIKPGQRINIPVKK